MLLMLFWLLALAPSTQPFDWRESPAGSVTIFACDSAPFPHASRAEGYTARDGSLFPADPHYQDRSVGIVIPPGYRSGDRIDFVVHFHGHRNSVKNALVQFDLVRQLELSKVNAVLVIPQGPLNAPDSGFGRLEEADGLKNLLSAVQAKLRVDGKTRATAIGSIILTAHSGGYKATAACLARGGVSDKVTDVILFDATYGGLEQFADFAAQPDRRLISIFTEHLASENYQLLTMLQSQKSRFELLLEDRWTEESLAPRQSSFIHTRTLAHNDVVSKKDYFATFLKTSGLPKR